MAYLLKTPCGTIRGTTCDYENVAAFKGIRYATAGRWEYPRLVTGWEGIYDATQYGAACWQDRAFLPEAADSFYHKEFRNGCSFTYSEDCLFLNIWVPLNVRKPKGLPVLVYIHGGAYLGCCGHEYPFDDPAWPTKGVIAVTINYRTGPLGFACIQEAAQESGHTGNYGLYDQMAALQWIQNNISAFGGNPKKVTIMGQSAGAMSVQHQCLSPLTHGLFHRAIMVSGGGGISNFPVQPVRKRMAFWNRVMERSGCRDLSQFRELPVDRLFAAWRMEAARKKGVWDHCGPCLDGHFIAENPIKQIRDGHQKNIAYMIGSTGDDMLRVKLHRLARKYCSDQALQGKRSSFAWFFDRSVPGDNSGAWHSTDLWYWFGTMRDCWRPMTDKDRELAELMQCYLTNFAKYGDPNGNGLPLWEAGRPTSRRVMRLDDGNPRMARVSTLALRLSAIAGAFKRIQ